MCLCLLSLSLHTRTHLTLLETMVALCVAACVCVLQGMRVRSDGPQLISQMVSRYLNIDCSVLMGANIAGAGAWRGAAGTALGIYACMG